MITIISIVALFLLGAVLASFINAFIYRLDANTLGWSFVNDRSVCEDCGKVLVWHELIPVLSFILGRGKCPKCGFEIPLLYPVSEFVLGFTFVTVYLYSNDTVYYFIALSLFVLSIMDLRSKSVYADFVHFILAVALLVKVYTFYVNPDLKLFLPVVEAFVLSAILFLISQYKRAFGFGDLLVFMFLGLLLPLYGVISVFWFSVVYGGLLGLVIMTVKKDIKNVRIPFIPFIYFGFLTYIAFKPFLDNFFLNLEYLLII